MMALLRHGNGLMKFTLAIACLALALLWPQWRVALHTQGYYPPGGEWCSPGYWKNHPDEADVAAEECGLDMDTTTYSPRSSALRRRVNPRECKTTRPQILRCARC